MLVRRRTLAMAVAALNVAALNVAALTGLGASPAQADMRKNDSRQEAFAQAAKDYRVPASVLMAVSYLESRWDANRGLPSTSGGFGPMHLVDGTLAPPPGHVAGEGEDARGDDARPLRVKTSAGQGKAPASTLQDAARTTGASQGELRTDPTLNIRGGAALLARYQRELNKPLSADPAAWAEAVSRYGGSAWFAGQVFDVLRTGASRTTDDGERVTLAGTPGLKVPVTGRSDRRTECPADLGCEWLPAPYQQLDPSNPASYGNHDLSNRPKNQKISYIVVHDTEESYADAVHAVQDPAYLGWHFTVRSADGHVAQHVLSKDVGWHAGNWYINTKSIGIEHEGFLAQGGSWYTEALYRSSAELVRHLAKKYDIPLDRGHIIGHDNVPGLRAATIKDMHVDPGPYWDWAHYFRLLGRPLKGSGGGGLVMIRPDYDRNVVPYTGCDAKNPSAPCPPHGGGSVMLRTEPREDAPLVKDIGKNPPTGTATMDVYDHSARAATGQKYAVAERRRDWTAIWYLGQKAWFHDPRNRPASVRVRGYVVVLKAASAPVYGGAYPEKEAFPANVPVPDLSPVQYVFASGQKYAVLGKTNSEYYYAKFFDPATHVLVRGKQKYYEIQFGHRVYFVKADDVVLKRAR
jgi:hypothetical protein